MLTREEGSSRNNHTRCCLIVARQWKRGRNNVELWSFHGFTLGCKHREDGGSVVAVRWWWSLSADVAAAVQDVTSCPERSSRNDAAVCFGGTGCRGAEAQDLPSLHHHPTIPPFEASKPRRTHSWQRLLTAVEKKKRVRLFHGRNFPKHCFSDWVLFHSMHGQRSSPRHGHGPHPPHLSWG